MLKSIYGVGFFVMGIAAVASVVAQAGDKTCPDGQCATAPCAAGKCDLAAGECGNCAACDKCPVAAAMQKLPQLTFLVGAEKTGCSKTADKLAQKSGDSIRFAVAGKTYEKESDAKLALAEETESFVNAFAETKVCKVSGKVSVAGQEFCCEHAARETADLVKAAMGSVQMTYLVGEKECHCPVEAKEIAEKTGKPTVFVVAKEKTGCNVTARLNLARAKYKAAVQAMVNSQAKAKDTDKVADI